LERQQFIKDNIADCIAFLAIYIPIIRKEVVVFTELWNNYNIRVQKKQPYYIKGKPRINYFWLKGNNVKNWGIPVDPEKIEKLQTDLEG
jgi:hypothetical protein